MRRHRRREIARGTVGACDVNRSHQRCQRCSSRTFDESGARAPRTLLDLVLIELEQRARKRRGALGTFRGILFERRRHGIVDSRRHPRQELRQPRRRSVQGRLRHLVEVVALVRKPSRQHLEEDRRRRVDVGARRDRLAEDLLGRHVPPRPRHRRVAERHGRDTEVEELDGGLVVLGGVKENVVRLDVTVHYRGLLLVRARERGQ